MTGEMTAAIANRKPQAARREPVSHAHGPDNPDRRARHHVTWVMRQKQETGNRDQKRIGDHQAPPSRPDRSYRKSQRKSRDRMRRRKAGVGFGSCKGSEVESVGVAANERAAPSGGPFHQLADNERYRYREQHELQTQTDRKQPPLRGASMAGAISATASSRTANSNST